MPAAKKGKGPNKPPKQQSTSKVWRESIKAAGESEKAWKKAEKAAESGEKAKIAAAKAAKAAWDQSIQTSKEARKEYFVARKYANTFYNEVMAGAKAIADQGGEFGKLTGKAKKTWAAAGAAAQKYYQNGDKANLKSMRVLKDVEDKLNSAQNDKSQLTAANLALLEAEILTKDQILQLDKEDQATAEKIVEVQKDKLAILKREAKLQDKINDAKTEGLNMVEKMKQGFHNLMSVQGLLLAGVTALIAVLKQGIVNTKAINTQLGVGVASSAAMAKNLAFAAPLAAAAGFSEEMSVAAAHAASVSGNLDLAKNAAIAVSDAAIAFQTGMEPEQVAQLAENLAITTDLSREGASAMLGSVASLAEMNKVAPKKVLEDLANNAESMAKFTDGSAESLAKAAVQAARLGIELSKSAAIGDKLLDLEESIASEFEASVLIGKELNYDRARQLALNNDIEGAVGEIVNQLGSEAEFNKMNAIQRQALADSIGVGVEDLASMVSKRGKADLDTGSDVPAKQLKTQMDLVKQGYIMSGKAEEHLDLLGNILSAIIALGAGQLLGKGISRMGKGIGRAVTNMLSRGKAGARLARMSGGGRFARAKGMIRGAAGSGLGKAIGIAGAAIEGFKAFGNLKKGFFDKGVPEAERNEARGAGVGGAAGLAIGAVLGGPIGAAIGGFVGRKLGGYMGKNWKSIKKFGKNLGALTKKGFTAGVKGIKAYYGGIADLGKKGFEKGKEILGEFGPKVVDMGKKIGGFGLKILQTATPIGLAKKAFDKFKDNMPAIKEGLSKARDTFVSVANSIGEKVGSGLMAAKDKAIEFKENVKQKFSSAINTAKSKMAELGSAAKEALVTKFQSIKTKVQEVANALPGLISGALSKAGALHAAFVENGGLLGAATDAWNFAKELVIGKEKGGPITKSGTYLVGEAGPELVNLSAGSHVVPNNKLQGGLEQGQYGEVDLEPLVAAIMSLKTELQQIKGHTKNTSKGVSNISIGSTT